MASDVLGSLFHKHFALSLLFSKIATGPRGPHYDSVYHHISKDIVRLGQERISAIFTNSPKNTESTKHEDWVERIPCRYYYIVQLAKESKLFAFAPKHAAAHIEATDSHQYNHSESAFLLAMVVMFLSLCLIAIFLTCLTGRDDRKSVPMQSLASLVLAFVIQQQQRLLEGK